MAEESIWATRSDVRTLGQDIITEMNRRFQEQADAGERKHAQNVARFDRQDAKLERIDTQVTKTNGRVSTLEEKVRELFQRTKERVKGITVKDAGLYIGIVAGAYFVLTTILGYHK